MTGGIAIVVNSVKSALRRRQGWGGEKEDSLVDREKISFVWDTPVPSECDAPEMTATFSSIIDQT